MASKVGNVKVKLSLDKTEYEKGILSASNSLKMLGGALGALGIGLGAMQIVEIGKNALKASSDFEQASISFEVMLGSAEKAQKLLKEIQGMANVTPFETQDLLDASKVLLNFGINLNEILPDLQMLGDISGGNKDKMRSLTLAFAQMSSAGRLMGQDLLQMVNAGFNPLQSISEKTGKSMAVLKDEMSEGKISVDMVRQAFIDATSEGGRFYKMMDKQSQSLEGVKSTMQDAYTLMTRSISDMAIPAIKEQIVEVTKYINATNESIIKMKDWAEINQTTIGTIKDAAVAIAALAVGIPLTNKALLTIIASMRSFGVVTASTSAYQIAFATLLKGNASLAMLQYRNAIIATTMSVRALTIAMLANPLTWVTLALGAGAAAWFAYQQNVKSTERAIKDLNAAQDQHVEKTIDAIGTLKELGGAQNLNYEQTKKLDDAIAYLTEKYPNYIGKLRQELKLKGEISRATAEQIANEMTLAKVKGLQEQRKKLDKDMASDRFWSNLVSPQGYLDRKPAGRYGVTKANQKRDDSLIAEQKNLEKERQAILNDLARLNKEQDDYASSSNSTAGGKKKKGKTDKQLAAEEKARLKEILDYKIALLEIEKYQTIKTDEEIYKIELQQADLKIKAAKQGTSEYAQALAAKYQLERDYYKKTAALKSQQLIDDLEYNKQRLNSTALDLELMYQANTISKTKLLQAEISLLQEKKRLESQALNEQLKLVQGNSAEEVKIKRASARIQEDIDREITQKSIDLQKEKQFAFRNFTQEVSSGWGNTVSGLIRGDMQLADAFDSMTSSLLNAFGNVCGQMVQKWLESHMSMDAIYKLFGIQKTATDAMLIGSNAAVTGSNIGTAMSNVALSESSALLTAINAALSTSNVAVASTSAAAAGTTAASAGVMAGASIGLGAAITTVVGPITQLAGAMALLAGSCLVVAVTMPIIAIATAVTALSAALAALSLGALNAIMVLTAPIALAFAPISVLLAAEFALIGLAAKLAATAVAQLAIALAAASAAAIPLVGWAIAPGAALATGAAITAAQTMVQFREQGGPVQKGMPYIVGEKRPELFIPDRSGTILPNTNALGGGGNTEYNSVIVNLNATDAKSFEGRIDELTDRIHKNLFGKIKKRQLKPLGT